MVDEMISIAMATYNGEKYLREQLDSILAQTHQNFELIVCDDCSTDSTVRILREYERNDSRIKVFENAVNLGFKKNFEKAIGLCSGDYIALSDQDDIWLPEHLSILLSNIHDRSLCCGDAELVDENNVLQNKLLSVADGVFDFPPANKILYRIIFNQSPFQGASQLLRKEFLKKVLPIPSKVRFHDAWFAACACFDNGINYVRIPITRYRRHSDSITIDSHAQDIRTSINKKHLLLFALGKYTIQTDRFAYCNHLEKIFGSDDSDFSDILKIMNEVKRKKLSIPSILKLYKNYEYIITKKTRSGFLRFLGRIMSWEDMPDD